MKKLSTICALAVVICLMTGSAFATTFKFDFYGGDTNYSKGDFENPQEIKLSASSTVFVDIWLVDWPTTVNLRAIDWFFRWDRGSLEVTAHICNNLKPSGKWDACSFDENKMSTGELWVTQASFPEGISTSDINLITITLRCKSAPSNSWIKAVKEYLVDVEGSMAYTMDEGGGKIKQFLSKKATTPSAGQTTTSTITMPSTTTNQSTTKTKQKGK